MMDPVQALIDAGAIPSTPFGPQSRYADAPLALFQRRPSEPRVVYVLRRFIPPPGALAAAGRHIVTALDRPDLLGAAYQGDALLYWRIADANAVVDPNELTEVVGKKIVIPQATGV